MEINYLLNLKNNNIQYVKGVGPKNAKKLKRLGIESVFDLLFYFPNDYEDRSDIKKTTEAEIGEKQTFIVKLGQFSKSRTRSGKYIYSLFAYDNHGSLTLTWFHNPKYLKKKIKSQKDDKYYIVYGKVKIYRRELQITHPDIIEYEKGIKKIKTLLPIYGLTEGITQNYLRKIIKNAFKKNNKYIKEYHSKKLKENNDLIDFKKAIEKIHFPDNKKILKKAKFRLIFDEFLAFNYIMEKRKSERKIISKQKYSIDDKKNKDFIDNLPFILTDSQKKVINEMIKDLQSGNCMYRLLQGDVGSGKTVVAAFIIFIAAYNNKQSAFMAPTTILANQHYSNIINYVKVKGYDINVELLTGNISKKQKQKIINKTANGDIDLLIGTHAMIYDKVKFNNLDLVLIDEQHKFGVEQRNTLKEKGKSPHYLIMTATPIPRTTALVYYGDTEISVIDEMPEGRKPVKTGIRYEQDRPKMYKFLKKEINKNNQVYVVYPLIEDNEDLDLKSAETMYEEFITHFGNNNVGLLHGRLDSSEKTEVMNKFKDNKISILVSTTVIEVGVDAPNATVLIVEHPERFGLSQLHQLRGRVGRSDKQSYCILFISKNINKETYKKLKAFTKTNDGFEIAKMDLQFRGSGKMLGEQQHGSFDFRIGDIFKSKKTFKKTKKIAKKILKLNNYNYFNKFAKIYFSGFDNIE